MKLKYQARSFHNLQYHKPLSQPSIGRLEEHPAQLLVTIEQDTLHKSQSALRNSSVASLLIFVSA